MRNAPQQWIDTAIVVAFEDRFEFVSEDSPFPLTRLRFLENKGGLAIGLAGMKSVGNVPASFCSKVFKEYEDQTWAHQSMDKLRRIVRRNARNP